MWLTNIDFNIDENSIDPRFFFRIDFEYYENLEIPILFNGFIKTSDNQRIAKIDCEYDNFYGSKNNISIPLVDEYQKNIIRRDEERTLHRNFSAQITQNSINHIEKLRLIDPQKRVFLNIDLEIVIFKYNNSDKKELIIERYNGTRQVEIAQSEWLNKYAPKLGIGEFLIIEFPKQSMKIGNDLKDEWIKKLIRARDRLDEMYLSLNEGR
jgi:hypothetical protein